jgi:hypothetical protein
MSDPTGSASNEKLRDELSAAFRRRESEISRRGARNIQRPEVELRRQRRTLTVMIPIAAAMGLETCDGRATLSARLCGRLSDRAARARGGSASGGGSHGVVRTLSGLDRRVERGPV